jgi:maltose alpha-D-glucosyltransferase/alpha-amylase
MQPLQGSPHLLPPVRTLEPTPPLTPQNQSPTRAQTPADAFEAPRAVPQHQDSPAAEVDAILHAFQPGAAPGPWSELTKFTSRADIEHVQSLAKTVAHNDAQAHSIVGAFCRALVKARSAQPESVARMQQSLPMDWYKDPVYYFYAQHFGTTEGKGAATFDDTARMLDHVQSLGIKNLYLLPHYESPMGDEGYDIASYDKVRQELGGNEAFDRFMSEATKRGIRVMSDAVYNHTSSEHPWFKGFTAGDPAKKDYYLDVTGDQRLGTVSVGNMGYNVIQHPDATVSMNVVMFPQASAENWIQVGVRKPEGGSDTRQVFHTFYPFQVDLNLRNPQVLEELFTVLGNEANKGMMGKRTDAAPFWFKERGTKNEGRPGTHAMQGLFKAFFRHVSNGRGITLPEVGASSAEALKYFGEEKSIAGTKTNTEGDAIFGFETQAALRESIFTRTAEPFWKTMRNLPKLPESGVWYNMIGHHDEMITDFFSDQSREKIREQLFHKGAVDFSKRGVGGRTANFLDHDSTRISQAYFLLYMAPGAPIIYYGDEIGWGHDKSFMHKQQDRRYDFMQTQPYQGTMDQALDPRDLNRGPVPAVKFDAARAEKYLPVETIRALNELREERPSLRQGTINEVICDQPDVIALVRSSDGDRPLLGLANLAAEERTVRLPLEVVQKQLGVIGPELPLTDVLGAKLGAKALDARLEGDVVVVTLPPHGFSLADVR